METGASVTTVSQYRMPSQQLLFYAADRVKREKQFVKNINNLSEICHTNASQIIRHTTSSPCMTEDQRTMAADTIWKELTENTSSVTNRQAMLHTGLT